MRYNVEHNMETMEHKLKQIADRIRELRLLSGLSVAEIAERMGISESEYEMCEAGNKNLSIAFLYHCALTFGVDMSDILEGKSPKLRSYALTRRGEGQKIEEAHHMVGYNLASGFRNRIGLPLYMEMNYREGAENEKIELVTHEGQECDIVISGQMKIQIGEHVEILNAGDSIYYDSGTPQGMVAVGGKDCSFYAIVLRNQAAREGEQEAAMSVATKRREEDKKKRIYHDFIIPTEKDGALTEIAFKNEEKFNFAFDVVDALGRKKPDKLAMLHISEDGTEHRFTFQDVKKESARVANYFKSLGIQRGDRVMLVLKRHYQFWFAMLGLHKLGAVAIPAPNQLLEKDFKYRFEAGKIKAILCTADGEVADSVDAAAVECPGLTHKILVGGSREGWHNFDEEYSISAVTSHARRMLPAAAILCSCTSLRVLRVIPRSRRITTNILSVTS